MPLRSYPGRLLLASALASATVLVLCGTLAGYLYREQARTADVLSEDIGSRGAAINVEATLNNLAALHERQSRDVDPLLDQVHSDLAEIDRWADKPRERELAQEVAAAFARYERKFDDRAPPAELADALRQDVLPAAQALRNYNGEQLTFSEQQHRAALRQLTWGLAVVGGLG